MLATALGAALVLVNSGAAHDKGSALAPVPHVSEAVPPAVAPTAEPQPAAAPPSGLSEGFGGFAPGMTTSPSSGPGPAPAFSPASAPAFNLGPARGFPAPPPPPQIDWNALVAAVVQTRNANAEAASAAGSIPGRVTGDLQTVTTLVTNLVLYAAYSQDGRNFLSQLQDSLDAAGLPAIAAAVPPQLPQLSPVDFSGLSAVYEALSAQPAPMGVTGPPPELPGPEQAPPVAVGPPPPSPDLSFIVQPPPPPPIWLPSIAPILGYPF